MKKTIIIVTACVLGTLVNAQSLSPVAIGSGYVNGSSSDAEISSTVGQTAYGVKEDGTSQLTEGVHQPKVEILNVEDNAPEIGMAIYPNPNSGRFYFELTNLEGKVYKGEVFDVNGVSIEKTQVSEETKSIDISGLPRGSYFLHVYGDDGVSMKQYKVMKVH